MQPIYILHTNQQHLPFVLDNNKLIQIHILSSRINHIPFQSLTTLWTRFFLFYIKFYEVLVDNTVVSNISMHSTLLLLLEPLFPLFKDNSYYVQFLSLIINLNYATLTLFYPNLSLSKIYNHMIYRLGTTLFFEAKVTLST